MQKNRAFRLPFLFDEEKLLADLATCLQTTWVSHFNTKDYAGEWTSISLQSKSGKSKDIYAFSGTDNAYQPTELLIQCAYFQEIIASFQAPLESIRLLNLLPNSEIKTHRDPGCCYEDGVFRLHIPITTDEKVDFVIDGERLEMQVATCWYGNFNLPHSVLHRGEKPRIHLIIDGIRNEWSDELFKQIGYDFELEKQAKQYSPETKKQMLEMLKQMNTVTARKLIEQLEAE
ncbi:MAG: aspartyl/asparaginyl beta-hydroxylase domain-containing protein [Bacteroidia bacterium]